MTKNTYMYKMHICKCKYTPGLSRCIFTRGFNLHMCKLTFTYAIAFTCPNIHPGANYTYMYNLHTVCKSTHVNGVLVILRENGKDLIQSFGINPYSNRAFLTNKETLPKSMGQQSFNWCYKPGYIFTFWNQWSSTRTRTTCSWFETQPLHFHRMKTTSDTHSFLVILR